MLVERAQEFERWYAQHDPDYVFDFQKELVAHCESDVLLLKGACKVFCMEFEEISGFKPLERCITIASACNLFYPTKHMPEVNWPPNLSVDGTGKANRILMQP